MGVAVTLEIDNFCDGDKIQTVVETVVADPPYPLAAGFDSSTDEFCDWEQDEIFVHTGTGRESGESAYFVKVAQSSRPDLLPIGTEFEFC